MPHPNEKRLDARLVALLVLLILDSLAALFIAQQIIIYQDYPFDTDEATHANNALILTLDLRAGDFRAFLRDSYQQAYYPPTFSWLRAVAYLVFGATPVVARMFSLACLFAAVLVIYAVGLELDEARGWLVGLVAGSLTLTAQPILDHAPLAMLETPGLLVSFALLWAYLRAMKRPSAARLLFTSLLLTLTFLTKYTYGLASLATLAIMGFSAALSPPKPERRLEWVRPLLWRWGWLFGPFVLAMLAWFGPPYKLNGLLAYVASQPVAERFSREGVLFYPRSIVLHYAPSPLFTLVMVASVIWTGVQWRHRGLRLLLLYLAVGLLEMLINSQKTPRFIVTFIPAAYLLTGAMLAWLAADWQRQWPRLEKRLAAAVTLLAVCLVSVVPVLGERLRAYPLLLQAQYETSPQANALAAWIEQQTAGQRFYLVNPWDQFSAATLEWRRATGNPPPGARYHELSLPWVFLQEPRPEQIAETRRQIQTTGSQYVVALEGGPAGGPYWPDYANALGDILIPAGRQQFAIEQYRVSGWLDQSPLTREGLSQAMSAGRYTLYVQATIYQVAGQ
ncbi:MAG: glycosyltransferase family 39 protein [Chloroflexi bacterium]|nr:glycosyltransferase family 39 protein [Chloroflexota bacterium]MCI0579575.1 glycosyltransferase family 39 protein [Chloroflexota bacterium]MCI0644330.1 glycosyltransferase family 39 protein [Chloroflexota bacterium]MCI0725133.1 glycosyltransferase family 39 protein [Chloroflexota bacterium]